MRVGIADNVVIDGFVVTGNGRKTVIVRAIGPSLAHAGISAAVADPMLEIHDSSGAVIATNDNWRDTQEKEFAPGGPYADLQPTDDRESAIAITLQPGAYTAVVRAKNGRTGVALAEVYDYSGGRRAKLANMSTRGLIRSGDDVLIGGLIIGGDLSTKLIVRALGPSLAQYGVLNVLANPTLELYDSTGALVASNDDWKDDPYNATQIEGTTLAPKNLQESAIVITLPAGDYTAVVRGKNSSSGVALFEVYRLQ